VQLGVRYAISVGYGGCCSRHMKRQFIAGRDYRLEQEGGVIEKAPSAVVDAAPLLSLEDGGAYHWPVAAEAPLVRDLASREAF
jgi:hypothetical protein